MRTVHSESESISFPLTALTLEHDVHTRAVSSSIVVILSYGPMDDACLKMPFLFYIFFSLSKDLKIIQR